MTFKTHCPCCGKKNGIKTLFSAMGFTFYACYKCKKGAGNSPIKIQAYRGKWEPPYSAAATYLSPCHGDALPN